MSITDPSAVDGEEFVVLLPDTDHEGALQAAEMRRAQMRPRGGGRGRTRRVLSRSARGQDQSRRG